MKPTTLERVNRAIARTEKARELAPCGEVWVTVDGDGVPVGCGLDESEERHEASGVPGARVFPYVPAESPQPKAQESNRLREARQLLRRMVKYAREDKAVTPRSTRLERLTEQVADYLQRTHNPRDLLREEPKAQGDGVPLRPVVQWFAEQMELALREHDDKGGWHEDAPHLLLARVLDETSELIDEMSEPGKAARAFASASWCAHSAAGALRSFGNFLECKGTGETLNEAVDVANMAMMVADHFRDGGPSRDQGQTLLPAPPKVP